MSSRPSPVLPPTLLAGWLEVSIHSPSRAMRADLAMVLPATPLSDDDPAQPPFLLVPTCQRAAMDLVAWGDAVAAEKDALLERFARWAGAVCAALAARGWWGDFVDPCSGLATRTPHSNAPYPEVDAFEALLRWRTSTAGGCRVLLHPQWGAAAYPATLFARAPLGALRDIMEAAAAEEEARLGAGGAAAGGGGAAQ